LGRCHSRYERSKQPALIKRFMRDKSGATAIEYGIVAAGISLAIITVVGKMGSKLKTTFTSVQTALKYAITLPG
jgi:pilus assembly protein Flp/PilA